MEQKFNSALAILPAISITGQLVLNRASIGSLILLAGLIFAVELAFFFIPGVSLSSLLIAMAAMHYGFVTTFVISIIPIVAAHFLLIRKPTVFIADILTIIPMILFGAYFGKTIIGFSGFWGWSILGALFSIVKWGIALPVGYMLGGSIPKRIRELFLEPAGSFFIFKLNFLFLFLFSGFVV